MVRQGFKKREVEDMDHVSLVALHDEVQKQLSLEDARNVELGAAAAQGSEKGIKGVTADLRKRAGIRPNKGLGDFMKDTGL